jgi:hypothetical protein
VKSSKSEVAQRCERASLIEKLGLMDRKWESDLRTFADTLKVRPERLLKVGGAPRSRWVAPLFLSVARSSLVFVSWSSLVSFHRRSLVFVIGRSLVCSLIRGVGRRVWWIVRLWCDRRVWWIVRFLWDVKVDDMWVLHRFSPRNQ